MSLQIGLGVRTDVPQLPQFNLSVWKSGQAPLQRNWPEPHLQVPETHDEPIGHYRVSICHIINVTRNRFGCFTVFPQLPQFFPSVCKFTQAQLHSDCPLLVHLQVPERHDELAGHWYRQSEVSINVNETLVAHAVLQLDYIARSFWRRY
jgi:hypothetical protein